MIENRLHSPEDEAVDAERLVSWSQETVPASTPIVLPFSGGLDSATIAGVLARSHRPDLIHAVHVSHDAQPGYETQRAHEVAGLLGINFIPVDTHNLNQQFRQTIDSVRSRLPIVGNGLPVTQNASLVYALTREMARSIGGRLAGTLDGSEIFTGYYPKECFSGDFLPLGGLFRTEVRRIATQLGLPDLPEAFSEVEGCGNIVEFVNTQMHQRGGRERSFLNELDLDTSLRAISSARLLNDDDAELARFCAIMRHKASGVSGRPMFYPSHDRRISIEGWLRRGDSV